MGLGQLQCERGMVCVEGRAGHVTSHHAVQCPALSQPNIAPPVQAYYSTFLSDMAYAQANGFPSFVWGAFSVLNSFFAASEQSVTPGVCATVVLQLSQQFVVERQAFLSTLSLGCPTGQSLANVSFALSVTDSTGQDVTDAFDFTAPMLQGFTQGLNYASGMGLAGGATGTVQITLASNNFNLTQEAQYYVGGWVSYTSVFGGANDTAGSPENITLVAAEIQVAPEPQLYLGYYVPQWISGDNPFTPVGGLACEAPSALGSGAVQCLPACMHACIPQMLALAATYAPHAPFPSHLPTHGP